MEGNKNEIIAVVSSVPIFKVYHKTGNMLHSLSVPHASLKPIAFLFVAVAVGHIQILSGAPA